VGWITEKKDGPLYAFNHPNISGWADAWGMPPFYIETNSEGMRDEEFRKEKPENTIRILVLGTSTTIGYGVNRSYTYPDILESQLNESYPYTDIQVLNAGSGGYGMKDYYVYIRERGLEYNPDIVVVSFMEIDWYSRRDVDNFNTSAREIAEEQADS
jgi:hypothetical protein